MNSPQAMICSSSSILFSFLFYGVVIICLTSANVSASSGGNETDYHALLSFKSKIIHDPYKVLSTWNHSFHFCDWIGITCGKRHKRVTVLRLYSKGLEGSLSPHVGNLSFLRKLSLVNNSFQGSIPHELGRLSRLRRLYLNDNKFSGVIPINLSGCSNLEELQLGGIPPFLGNITSVEMFSALRNSFGGSIPDTLGNNELCGGLVTLELPKCKEKGSKKKRFPFFILVIVIALTPLRAFYTTEFNWGGGVHVVYKGILDSYEIGLLHQSYTSSNLECKYIKTQPSSKGKYSQRCCHRTYNCCETTIVHGDLKPSNILLDIDLVALLETLVSSDAWTAVNQNLLKVWYRDRVIYDDAIVLQSTKANAKKMEECLAAIIKIGVSCSMDSPPERVKIGIVVNELQRILDVYHQAEAIFIRELDMTERGRSYAIRGKGTRRANTSQRLAADSPMAAFHITGEKKQEIEHKKFMGVWCDT
ncbi:kinase-like domain-containing protein, partial [Tanacetum coccineum]